MEWVPNHPQPQHDVDPCQDAESEGQELYLHFFHERLRREGLAEAAREEEWAGQYHMEGAHLHQEDNNDEDTNENYPVDEDDCGRLTMRRGERPSCPRKRKESMNLENFQVVLYLFGH